MTTIRVTDCNSHKPIAYALVRDDWGNWGYTDGNGYIIDLSDVPGSVIYVSAAGYNPTNFVLTGQEVQNAFAPICLTPAPPAPSGGKSGLY